MDVLIVRHGLAGDKQAWRRARRDDADRPLTKEGIEKMKQAAKGLARLVPTIDRLYTSPYARAAQTAEIIADRIPCSKKFATASLKPGVSPGRIWQDLLGGKFRGVVCLVGHQPHLGRALQTALGSRREMIDLKKGSVTLIRFPERPKTGTAVLQWSIRAGQLARLR